VRVGSSDRRSLDDLAERTGLTASLLIRQALAEFLERRQEEAA
jgi:predicted transcriptional regulator